MGAMTRPGTEIDAAVTARLRLAVMRLARRLRGQSEGDVTASQLSAISSLRRRGALTLGELSAVERVKPPTMTRIVTSLEEMGMVDRLPDPDDRRVCRVELTTAGRRLIEGNQRRKDAYLAARLAALSDADRAAVVDAVDALERMLEEGQ